MDKHAKLKELETEIAADAALPLREANLVFGEGNVDCDVMFVGEAPGFNEDRLKRPFVGRGGAERGQNHISFPQAAQVNCAILKLCNIKGVFGFGRRSWWY